jgi:hypothetical protein
MATALVLFVMALATAAGIAFAWTRKARLQRRKEERRMLKAFVEAKVRKIADLAEDQSLGLEEQRAAIDACFIEILATDTRGEFADMVVESENFANRRLANRAAKPGAGG